MSEFCNHVNQVRSSVLAIALPTEQEYLQLLTDDSAPPCPASYSISLDHTVILEAKQMMRVPITNENVAAEWRTVYIILPTVVLFVMLLIMVIILFAWRP